MYILLLLTEYNVKKHVHLGMMWLSVLLEGQIKCSTDEIIVPAIVKGLIKRVEEACHKLYMHFCICLMTSTEEVLTIVELSDKTVKGFQELWQ